MKGKPKEVENLDQPKTISNALHYALSDCGFIDSGWTILPEHKLLRKEKVFITKPNKLSQDWISRNEILSKVFYKDGQLLANLWRDNCKVFYKSGKIAFEVSYYKTEDCEYKRYVLREESSNAPLGIFDTLGRGIVYGPVGNLRLKYNQTEAVLLDTSVGRPRSWKWNHQRDKPEFENIIKDMTIYPPDEEINKLLEQDQSKEKGGKSTKNTNVDQKQKTSPAKQKISPSKQKISPTKQTEVEEKLPEKYEKQIVKIFKPYPVMPIVLKINQYFTLKIIDQRNMYFAFQFDSLKMKIELGVILTNKFIETNLVSPEYGSTVFEEIPPKTESIAFLQDYINDAQEKEKQRLKQIEKFKTVQGKPLWTYQV